MPAQSHGGSRFNTHSKSTPNLAALRTTSSSSTQDDAPKTPDTHSLPPAILPSIERHSSANSSTHDDADAYAHAGLSSSSTTDDEDAADFHRAHALTRTSTDPVRPQSSGLLSPPPSGSLGPRPRRPLYASRSQSYLGPPSFAPPFYNRPPTPLPPSPSLTSLLRPPFSAAPSRPATPDSSDTEATGVTVATSLASGTSAAGAVARSALTATTVPRASPKVPTYEYYGFVLYLGSSAAFGMYLLWSYLPQPFLHQLGIYYYPDRWWSLAIPAWLVALVLYIYAALAAYNTGYLTLPLSHLGCLVDDAADVAVVDARGRIVKKRARKPPYPRRAQTSGAEGRGGLDARARARSKVQVSAQRSVHPYTHERSAGLDWRGIWSESTDGVMDVPIAGVCEVLYGEDDDT